MNIQNPSLSVVSITKDDVAGLTKTGASIPDIGSRWVVVDGSSNSVDSRLVDEFVRSRGGTFIRQRSRGRFAAMNEGLDQVQTELVLFMNGGDQFAHPAAVGEIEAAAKEDSWSWAVGRCLAVDGEGTTVWEYPIPKVGSALLRIGLQSYPHQATVYRSSVLRMSGAFDSSSLYADWVKSLQLMRQEPPRIYSATWAKFLIGGASSQQSLHFWAIESRRLRRNSRSVIGGVALVDWAVQVGACLALRRSKWAAYRSDLIRECGCNRVHRVLLTSSKAGSASQCWTHEV